MIHSRPEIPRPLAAAAADMKKKGTNMFELPPKCPALADKITGIFGWRHTYQVHQRQKGIAHGNQYLHKSYSLNLPRTGRTGGGSMSSVASSLAGGVSLQLPGGSTASSSSSYQHRRHHHHTSSSCCVTEPGTPNCETNPDSWVVVHHLQSQAGILDPEDHISDVADDREEIIASYEDAGVGPDPGVQQGGGDGASGSSVGTGSPDIFQVGGSKVVVVGGGPGGVNSAGEPPPDDEVGVGAGTVGGDGGVEAVIVGANGGGGTGVAAGPAPAGGGAGGGGSSCIEVSANEPGPLGLGLQVRRGSEPSLHQIGVTDQRSPLYNVNPHGHHQETSKRWSAAPVCRSDSDPPQQSEQQQNGGLGGAGGVGSSSEMLLVVNETGGPLGLTAIPDKDRGGLLVQSVEPGSRAERGRLRRGDRILEINNIKLVGLSESSVQEHLKKSLASTELRLRVVRGTARKTTGPDQKEQPQQQQQPFAGAPGRLVTGGSGSRYHRRDNRVGQMMIEAEEERPTSATKVATVSPTRKMPGAPSTAASSLQVANTRKLGKRIEITLTKGDHGLGFSVTTRDNPAGGHCPIYIKNILPKGAAVEDGRLKPGDRLLEVEGIPMTGKSQTEVVSILRGTPHGATLKIVVSRQQELADVTKEREIGFGVESEPKSTTVPKPPPPVMPKSSLKQSNSSNSLAGGHHQLDGGGGAADEGVRGGVSGSRSMQKLPSSSSPKTPTVQKKPLASILKSASTNQVADLLLLHDAQVNGMDNGAGGGGGASLTFTNGTGGGGGGGSGASLSGAAWKNREILTLHIPVHDTEKAGLGVSVKGKTGSGNSSSSQGSGSNTSRTDGDLGIFVKSVLHGGAASRDGRLKMNDQLLSVNGVSLLGQSNAEAMETLRRAMLQQSGGSYPGKIILTVARRIGRPVSTGELLETIDPRPTGSSSAIVANGDQPQQSGSAGTTVIYLSPDKQQQQQQQHRPQDNSEPKLQQSKRYSNPVLDRLTGGSGAGAGGNAAGNHGVGTSQTPPAHGLRNESYYMATGEHWNTTSSATSLNGSNAVLIEEDPEPTSPTFHLARPSDVGGGAVLLGNGSTSTPNGADTTYASQLSLETNPPPSDAFSRDAVGRRSMSEKHHAAMDARETGTYQRNKKLREERERDSKLLLLGGGPSAIGSVGVSGGSMESISHQMARIDSLRHGGRGGGGVGKQQPTAALAAHLLRDEAQDQLGDLGPSLGMKKSSSLESLQTMVQEIQMADEPRGPNALRTPRGRGRDEILRALVEQPPEATQAKKHWLLEEGPTSGAVGGAGATELPDGGFVSRNSPFQSSLNDGKGAKLRVKKSGGLLRGIGHMFRFGKHRKDGIAPTMANTTSAINAESAGGADYSTIGGPSGPQAAAASAWMNESSNGSSGGGVAAGSQKYGSGGNASATKGGGGANGTAAAPNNGSNSNNSAAAASRYILFDPNSVERSASSGVVYGHHQPPHYQPPPPPPGAGASGGATSIHHTDVFNHRYSHYVNYEELQQQISRRHHHYHSQRSARNTPPVGDIGLLATAPQSQQNQPPSHHHHTVSVHNQSHSQQQQKYKSARPTSCYYDSAGGGYETISSIGPPLNGGGGGGSSSSMHRKSSGSQGGANAGTNNIISSSSTNTHTMLTVSSSSSSSNGNGMLPEDANGGSGVGAAATDWHLHHHPGPNGAGGGTVTTGSMRNTRGPFVTQVKIQNQMSYQ
uniref:PDZ domain-containing protein n=1 Tax=Anopheles atroparvus TaxID=41427 RepID=A0A182IRN4_ANOAO